MSRKAKIRGILGKKGIHNYDIVIFLLFMALLFLLKGNVPYLQDLVSFRSEISLGYIVKQQGDRIYVIDSGHSRLLCFDTAGNEIFEVTDPSDDGESVLYIDDIAPDEDGLYLSASEWDGMQIAREVILRLDRNGQYVNTVVSRDYDGKAVNKHRLYGTVSSEDDLVCAECLDGSILLHRIDPETLSDDVETLVYRDAFNAVGDIVFDADLQPVILGKNGKISRFLTGGTMETVYSTEWSGEEDRVPYRLGIFGDRVCFTDIRGGQIVQADPDGHKGLVCYDGTDSQTVAFTPEGDILLTESDGVRVSGAQDRLYLDFARPGAMIRYQILILAGLTVLMLLFVFLLIRIIVQLTRHQYTLTQGVAFAIIVSVIVVTGLISGMLLHSFRVTYKDKIKEQLEGAAYAVARQISEEEMDSIRTTADYEGEAYRSISALMENNLPAEQEFYSQIYCNIQRMDLEQDTGYAIAYLDRSIGVYFPLDEFETDGVRRVYETGVPVWDDESSDVSGTYLAVKVPILGDGDRVVGVVSVGVDISVINETLNAMQNRVILSVIVIAMLLWVVAAESMSYILAGDSKSKKKADGEEQTFPAQLIRMLVFLVFSAYNLSSTFLPVYVLRNSELFHGELRNLAASLPLTVNIFALGIMSLFCAGLVRRAGMRRIMIWGAAFALCGNLLLLLIPHYFAIFLGLLLDGIGEGLIMNALYVILTYIRNEEDRRNGFSIYNAAYLSGVNFGMLGGSLLAVAFGQRPVFLVSVLTWALLMGLGLYLVRNLEGMLTEELSAEGGTEDREEEQKEAASALQFISDKAVLSFILLIQNPYIVFNSFVFYLVPLYCSARGYEETIVSILIMLYSQIAVLSGDYLTEHVSARFGDRAMYVALLMNVAAVLLFALTGSMDGLIFALMILGFSAAFGKPVQQSYFLDRKAAVRYGEDRSIGVYNFTENIGESLGPIVFSRLTGAAVRGYMTFLAVVTGCCGLHFMMNSKGMKREE